jgi:hypothetical protein
MKGLPCEERDRQAEGRRRSRARGTTPFHYTGCGCHVEEKRRVGIARPGDFLQVFSL